jgi:hypothetical protein
MNDCNCNCCCAYLNPPWWVTMGFVPPGGAQVQGPPTPPNTPPRTNGTTGGARVPLPDPAVDPSAIGAAPIAPRPNPVATIAGDLLRADPVALLNDVAKLL